MSPVHQPCFSVLVRVTVPILLVSVASLLTSCEGNKAPVDKPASASRSIPTSAEIFDLRSKCAALGEKILEGNAIGSALTQEQVTHYNPQTNRCYVRLEVHTADFTTPQEKRIDHLTLYDGQTREMLVLASVEASRKTGYIVDGFEVAAPGHPTGVMANYEDAATLIDKYMADDRKQ
jgi:hypothetical protein